MIIADESVIIYNKYFQIPASPRDFSRSIIVRFVATAHMRMQLFYTSACRLALRKRSKASPPAACRLFFLSPRPPGFSNFQTLSFDPQPHNEQRGSRSITAENPGASFLSSVLAPLSLSLSYTLRLLSYPLVHTQTCAERVHMLGHNGAARGLSTLLDPFRHQRVQRFLLDFTRLHRNRIFTVTEATILTVERRERRQCNDCRMTITDN